MKRNGRFDLLRILMSILVVLLHVSANGCYAEPTSVAPVLMNAMGRIAVPFFFMVTGAISLSRSQPVRRIWLRMLQRIVLPLAVASFAYAGFRTISAGESFEAIVLQLGSVPAYYHLAFMYRMAGLYLLLPLLQPGWKAIGVRARLMLTGILTLTMCLSGKGLLLPILPVGTYIVHALLGACCMDIAAWCKQHLCGLRIWSLLGFLGYAACTIGTWLSVCAQSEALGSLSEASLTYDSPLITLGAVMFFLAIMVYPAFPRETQCGRFLARWNSYTLGIYLVYPMMIALLTGKALTVAGRSIQLSWNMFHPALAIPILTALIYSISLALIALLYFLGGTARKAVTKKADSV